MPLEIAFPHRLLLEFDVSLTDIGSVFLLLLLLEFSAIVSCAPVCFTFGGLWLISGRADISDAVAGDDACVEDGDLDFNSCGGSAEMIRFW